MATYQYYKQGYAIPHHHPGDAPYKKNIDCAAAAAGGVNYGFANSAGARVALASTGWAASDVLKVFKVPAGFLLQIVGCRVTTAEGGAATADIGNASATETHLLGAAAAGMMGTCDLNSEATQITLVADTDLGANTVQGLAFITNGSIDITWITAATAVCVADWFACGWKVW